MKRKVALLVVLAGFAVTLSAFGGPGSMKENREHYIREVLCELELSTEQREKVRAVKQAMRDSRKNMRKERQPLNFSSFMTPESFDKEAFKRSMMAKMEVRASARADGMGKIFEILTPEQRALFIEKMSKPQ